MSYTNIKIIIIVKSIITVKIIPTSIGIKNVNWYLKYKREIDDKNINTINNTDDCSNLFIMFTPINNVYKLILIPFVILLKLNF